jgi:hypothetical protein
MKKKKSHNVPQLRFTYFSVSGHILVVILVISLLEETREWDTYRQTESALAGGSPRHRTRSLV